MWMGEQINQKGRRQRHLHHLVCRYRRSSSGYDGSDLELLLAAMQFRQLRQFFFFAPLFHHPFPRGYLGHRFHERAKRRIPIQYAKKVVGRKVYGGGQARSCRSKLTMSGVMPIIFASQSFHSEHHSPLSRFRRNRRFLGCILCSIPPPAGCTVFLPACSSLCLLISIHDDPVQPD